MSVTCSKVEVMKEKEAAKRSKLDLDSKFGVDENKKYHGRFSLLKSSMVRGQVGEVYLGKKASW